MPSRPFRLQPENPKEVDRQASVIRYLLQNPRVKFVIRLNGGGRFIKNAFVWFYKLFVPGYQPCHGKGMTDLIGMLDDARWFALEIKRPNSRTEKERAALQAACVQRVIHAGGIAGIVENWEQVEALILADDQREQHALTALWGWVRNNPKCEFEDFLSAWKRARRISGGVDD